MRPPATCCWRRRVAPVAARGFVSRTTWHKRRSCRARRRSRPWAGRPHRPRLAPPYRRAVLVLAVVVALVAVLASTAPAISNWIGDVIGKKEVDSEYVAAQSDLRLPPGSSWPEQNFPR